MKLHERIYKIATDLTVETSFRGLGDETLADLEHSRGKPYAHVYRSKKEAELSRIIRSYVEQHHMATIDVTGISGKDLFEPAEPVMEIQEHRKKCDNLAYFRFQGRDAGEDPPRPAGVVTYERECQQLEDEIASRLTARNLIKFPPGLVEAIKRSILNKVANPRAARNPRPRRQSTGLPCDDWLVGDDLRTNLNPDLDSYVEPPRRPQEPSLLKAEDVRRLVKLPLVLVEDLHVNGEQRAAFERRNESRTHRDLVVAMTNVLRRQGYSIYPGGVGLGGYLNWPTCLP